MTDPNDAPRDAGADRLPPDPAADTGTQAMPPTLWVTGLIVLVLLLLAVFALG